MPQQVIMPQLGESVSEATVTKWLKSPGEPVQEYEPLLEVNTDKVDTEIPSPTSGILLEILVPEGNTVSAGVVLALIAESDETFPKDRPEKESQPLPADAGVTPEGESTRLSLDESSRKKPEGPGRDLGFISPVVAKIAREHDLDLHQVKGSGLGGRITKDDVLAYLAHSPEQSLQIPGSDHPEGFLPLTPVRRAIAEHMVLSKHTAPHVTTVMEADMSRVVKHREANKAAFAQEGISLTYTAYFVAAAVAALQAFPIVNSSWNEAGINIHPHIHIGIATSLGEEGLIVPVIKHADSFSLLGLARALNDLVSRARTRKLQPEDVRGGTFTITNHGTGGSLFATPIIHQPQCAILGVGSIQRRVVVIDQVETGEAIGIRPMVYLSLTFDHRILDGAVGDAFLSKVVETLQNWP